MSDYHDFNDYLLYRPTTTVVPAQTPYVRQKKDYYKMYKVDHNGRLITTEFVALNPNYSFLNYRDQTAAERSVWDGYRFG